MPTGVIETQLSDLISPAHQIVILPHNFLHCRHTLLIMSYDTDRYDLSFYNINIFFLSATYNFILIISIQIILYVSLVFLGIIRLLNL